MQARAEYYIIDAMNEWRGLGIIILIAGITLTLFGLILLTIGKLPGDIVIKKDNFTLFFPIVTSIVLSIILTIVLSILSKR